MSFQELKLHAHLIEQIKKKGFEQPSEIQKATIPSALNGKDIIACAKTGSGKTLAFLLPILNDFIEKYGLDGRSENFPVGLIMAPTRELALQISEETEWLSAGAKIRIVPIFGGADYDRQKAQLQDGVDIIVATPGRLMDFMRSKDVDISRVERVVLDEADRMLDMGFIDDVKFIVSKTSEQKKTYLFSATMDYNAIYAVWKWMEDPEEFLINPELIDHSNIKQEVLHLGKDEKIGYLVQLIEATELEPIIVFTNSRQFVEVLVNNLTYHNVPAQGLSSVVTQKKRIRVLEDFKERKFRVLVATDVASRGLHIEDVQLVVNYDIPQDPESYVHRIGRTARAGKSGQALSICSEMDYDDFGKLERYLKYKIPVVSPEERFIENLSFLKIVRAPAGNRDERESRSSNQRPNRNQNNSQGSRRENFQRNTPEKRPPRERNEQRRPQNDRVPYEKRQRTERVHSAADDQPSEIRVINVAGNNPKKGFFAKLLSWVGIGKKEKPVPQISARTLAHIEKENQEQKRPNRNNRHRGQRPGQRGPRQGPRPEKNGDSQRAEAKTPESTERTGGNKNKRRRRPRHKKPSAEQ
ncbi:MAG: DEAD/DEAH box helicase [Leptospiraceae bacterium]|nr:DEAD/DEAH box helicase [Leptospiraceae bacterium]